MKKIISLIIIINTVIFSYSQSIFTYSHLGNKIYYDNIDSLSILNIENVDDSVRQKISHIKEGVQKLDEYLYIVNTNTRPIDNIVSDSDNIFISKILLTKDSNVLWTTQKILIKTNGNRRIDSILVQHNVPYVSYEQFDTENNIYLVELQGNKDISIEVANYLYKTGEVYFAEPDFGLFIKKQNQYYSEQWALNNTGQNNGKTGIDINVDSVWNVSTGRGIKVAVLDEGVDLLHEDLNGNLLPGYDATGGNNNGGYQNKESHGTNCAGIISAEDNDIGIKGVAYNSNVIPIRIAHNHTVKINGMIFTNWTKNSWISNGIYKAWHDYNADVLSNSWGGGSPTSAITDAINNAITQGRNGKGCVVVFASGNSSKSQVEYPSSLDGVISVGALDRCGIRSGRADIVPQS